MIRLLSGLRSRRPMIAAVLLFSYLAGCSSWQVGAPTPAEYLAKKRPETVRVTRNDASTVILTNATVREDSLFGVTMAGFQPADSVRHLAIPLDDIRLVEGQHTSVATGLGILGGVMLVLAVIGCAAEDSSFSPC